MLFHPRRKYYKIRGFLKSFRPKAIVLLYHRVIDLELDPQELAVSITNFNNQIKYLSEKYEVVPLKNLLSNRLSWSVKRKVAITFDDGYFDNYNNALPILKKYNLPATIFVSSGLVGSNYEFWWDSLEQIFLANPDLPDYLRFNVKNTFYEYDSVTANKEIIYNNLIQIFKSLDSVQIHETIGYLRDWGKVGSGARNTHKCLNSLEIISLSNSALIEIGAHTVNHCKLSNENAEIQKYEIETSKEQLEQLTSKNISSFSYPFGSSVDFTNESARFVKEAGFTLGISNIQGLLFNNADKFLVPRLLIRNWNQMEFSKRLDTIFTFNDF